MLEHTDAAYRFTGGLFEHREVSIIRQRDGSWRARMMDGETLLLNATRGEPRELLITMAKSLGRWFGPEGPPIREQTSLF